MNYDLINISWRNIFDFRFQKHPVQKYQPTHTSICEVKAEQQTSRMMRSTCVQYNIGLMAPEKRATLFTATII